MPHPFLGGIDRHPGAIVRAANADDVRRVITVARENVELAVRGGGHSIVGHSLTEGDVLDLRDLDAFDVARSKRATTPRTCPI